MLWKPIPGETPIEDASGLKIKGVYTRTELNPYEAKNILKATTKYLASKPSKREAPFDFVWALKLHREMFGTVWAWAGQLRTRSLNLGTDPTQIEAGLMELCQNLKEQKLTETYDHIDQAVWLHHRAVLIHPFTNGNGRWSRLLTNIWLKQNNQSPVHWPETVGEVSPIRERYIEALKKADNFDFEQLKQLHVEYLPTAN